MFVWSANFLSQAILLETITLLNGNNLRKSEEVARDFCLRFWKTDISALDELIRVLDIIGSRTALGCNDMSLCGLYDATIYQWINHVGVCDDYAFLLSYGNCGKRH